MINPALFSSKTGEHTTPRSLFDPLNEQYKFTLDVASTAENALCPTFYTEEEDGLVLPWTGRVWCNPPYGRGIGDWVKKGYETESAEVVVMLLPARTDTKWFHQYIWYTSWNAPYHGVKLQFLKGRLKFSNAKNSAPFPSMLVVFK